LSRTSTAPRTETATTGEYHPIQSSVIVCADDDAQVLVRRHGRA
jgi:hypothetical protein